jgi:ABC-type glutathione transport system ATPase component
MDEILFVSEVSKTYWRGGQPLDALKDVSLWVRPAAIATVVGERHEGKTTLLKVAAGIEPPDNGRVLFCGRDIWKLSDSQRERMRGDEIAWTSRARPGLDWEMRDYVGLRMAIGRSHGRRRVRAQAVAALKRVGAEECAERRWSELSDWQRVLVGLACGIVSRPRLLVIDDLFDGLGISKMQAAGDLLSSLAQELGCGVLMSASGMEVALMADAVWMFGGGALQLMSDQTAGSGEVVEFPGSVRRSRGSGS